MKHPPPLRGASAGEVGDLRIRSGSGTEEGIEVSRIESGSQEPAQEGQHTNTSPTLDDIVNHGTPTDDAEVNGQEEEARTVDALPPAEEDTSGSDEDGSVTDESSGPESPGPAPASPVTSESSLEDIPDSIKLDSGSSSPKSAHESCHTPGLSDNDSKRTSSLGSPVSVFSGSSPEIKGSSIHSSDMDDSSSLKSGQASDKASSIHSSDACTISSSASVSDDSINSGALADHGSTNSGRESHASDPTGNPSSRPSSLRHAPVDTTLAQPRLFRRLADTVRQRMGLAGNRLSVPQIVEPTPDDAISMASSEDRAPSYGPGSDVASSGANSEVASNSSLYGRDDDSRVEADTASPSTEAPWSPALETDASSKDDASDVSSLSSMSRKRTGKARHSDMKFPLKRASSSATTRSDVSSISDIASGSSTPSRSSKSLSRSDFTATGKSIGLSTPRRSWKSLRRSDTSATTRTFATEISEGSINDRDLHTPDLSTPDPNSPGLDSFCNDSASETRRSIRSDPFTDILEIGEDEPQHPPEPKDPAVILTPKELAFQRYGFFAAVLTLNIMCIILSYVQHKGAAIFATVLFIKSRDVFSSVIAAFGLFFRAIKLWFFPLPAVDPQFILTLIPAYSESQEQIIKAIFALQNNGVEPHHQVMLVILDGKPRDIKSSMTRVLRTFRRPYDTFKWKRIELEITAGFIEEVPVLVIQKLTNAGKKDSLIMANDLFNYPRDDVPLHTRRLRKELWTDVLPDLTRDFSTPFTKFDMMFCTDADSKIHEGALLKLANSLVHEPRAIAACGLVLVELEPGYEWSAWNLYQQFQYCYGQYVRRRAEHFWGKVTCLPGCITMIAMRPECGPAMKKYAEPITHHNVIAHQVQYLGTDRRQTYSLLSQDRGLQTLFVPDAVSETVAPQSLTHYLNQRRRWGSNAYFNNYFYCFGERMVPITRLVATLELVRLTLVYWRFSNTIQFLTGVVKHAHAGNFNILSLAPLISIGQLPFIWFVFCVFKEKPLRDRAHKLALGFCINKFVAPFMSMAVFTKVAMNVGSQVWGISGVTASSAPVAATAPVEVAVMAEVPADSTGNPVEIVVDTKAELVVLADPVALADVAAEAIASSVCGSDSGTTAVNDDDDRDAFSAIGKLPIARPSYRRSSVTFEDAELSLSNRSSWADGKARTRWRSGTFSNGTPKSIDVSAAQSYSPADGMLGKGQMHSPTSPGSPGSPGSPVMPGSPASTADTLVGPSRSTSFVTRTNSIDSMMTMVEEPQTPLVRRASVGYGDTTKGRKLSVFGTLRDLTITEEEEKGEAKATTVQQGKVFREYLVKKPIEDVNPPVTPIFREYLAKRPIADIDPVRPTLSKSRWRQDRPDCEIDM